MNTNISQSNFVRFDSNGLELVVDTTTGLAYASTSAAARMLGIETIQVKRALTKGGRNFDVVNAEIPTVGGSQGGTNLLSSNTLFGLAFDFNIELAKKMGSAGANVYMLGLAGYKVAIESALPTDELGWMELAVAKKKQSIAQAKEIEKLALDKQLLEAENQELSEAVDELFSYSSIIRIAKFNKCSEKNFNWRSLKKSLIDLNLEIKEVPCPRFQYKKLYSHDAWRLAYPGFRLPETTTLIIKSFDQTNLSLVEV